MSRRFRKLIQELKAVAMTTAERERVREALFRHMEANPAAEDARVRRMLRGTRGFTRRMRPVPLFARFAPALIVLVLLSSIGGVSLAAERAVPGEVLYPVKIHVNENVRSVLTIRPEQKVAWDVSRVERRVREAETLAARGELTEERSIQLSLSVARYSESLATTMQELGTADGVFALSDAGEDAALLLEGHDEVLLGIASGMTGESTHDGFGGGQEVSRVVDALREATQSLETASQEPNKEEPPLTEGQINETVTIEEPSLEIIERAEGRYVRAEERIAEARAYLQSNKEGLSELVTLQAGRIIRSAEEQLHLGEGQLVSGEYVSAASVFLEAQRLARRAMLLAETNVMLEVEVDIEEVDIETGEPLTDQELSPASDTNTDGGVATLSGTEADASQDPVTDQSEVSVLPPDQI